MQKARIYTTPARYTFTAEHEATAALNLGEQSLPAEPLDVSRHYLCVLCDSDAHLKPGDTVAQVKVSLYGRDYVFHNLQVEKRAETANNRKVRLVLQSDDHDETPRLLWELSYAVRKVRECDSEEQYDELTLPKVPARGVYTEDARLQRLAFVRNETGAALEQIAQNTLDPTALVSNIEAFIGTVEIPVGVAGPLHICGEHARGLFYAPMATSEGALVASATRGATAISRSGGVNVRVLGQRMLRVPVFSLGSLSAAMFFAEWVKDHKQDIAAQTRKYSNYANLVDVRAELVGHAVHVQFAYETGDAAGQNMTTTCTWQACQWILAEMQHYPHIEFENFLIEANLSNDKKVTYNSFLQGRGIRVLAECTLTDEICQKVLKISAQKLFSAYNQFVGGSIAAGMVGININIANVIAAMFTATGQDIACVHESAIGQLHMEMTADGDIYAAMRLPGLVVGSIGGGTRLPQQRECLEMMGCAGAGSAHKLAEVIASFCLALDLSTLSAIASDQFARAHEKLGRNRPVEWLKAADLDAAFFNRAMKNTFGDAAQVEAVDEIRLNQKGSSIITELTAHKINKLVGHFPFNLTLAEQSEPLAVMVKVKPLDDEVILMLNSMAAMCDARLAHAYNEYRDQLGFKGCHTRELAIMAQDDERFARHMPRTYLSWQDDSREAYVLVQELLQDMELMDSADDTRSWTTEHLNAAVDGLAEMHSVWYGREDELLKTGWVSHVPTRESMLEKTRLWEMLGAHAIQEFPEWFSDADMSRFRDRVYSLGDWYAEIDAMPKTLIHNDFNPRNIAFRRNGEELRLCAYDWELATLHLPQHDLAELLIFTLQPDFNQDEVEALIERHRLKLQQCSGQIIDAEQWRRGVTLCLWDLAVCRVPMYVMAHTFRHYPFMARVLATFRRLLDNEVERLLCATV